MGIDREVILVYNHSMKTAISIPDRLFGRADALARRMKVSRSELYATAVAEYVAKHQDEKTTARLNAVYSELHSGMDPLLRRAQARSTSEEW